MFYGAGIGLRRFCILEVIMEKEIQKFLANFQMQELKYGEHHAKQSHRLGENSEIARMYAKIAI